MIYAHMNYAISRKPRLRRRCGLWICFVEGVWHVSTGNTPAEAYQAWIKRAQPTGAIRLDR